MSFEYFIGKRYLRSKQKQAFISLINFLAIAGVTVGVMALIVVIAVMSGAEDFFKSSILGVEPHIVILKHGGNFTNYKEVITQIKKVKEVESAEPLIYAQVMLRSSYGVSGSVLRGIDPESEGIIIKNSNGTPVEKSIFLNQALPEQDAPKIPGIIIGKGLAQALSAIEGEIIYLISPRGILSPIGHLPAMKRFKVIGIFESGMYEYDETLAFITITDAQEILKMGNEITGIGIKLNDAYKAEQIAETINTQIGFPYWTKDWMQMNHNLFAALKLEKIAMFIILALIVIVAAFNIASTLIMVVMEKKKDIAILKAMGATKKSIAKIFIFKGLFIGGFGTFLGTSLGIIICKILERYKFITLPGNVYYFKTLPVQLNFVDVLLITSSAMLICFISTLYPAIQASKVNPVEAIRYG
ncbi:MAG: lipoprotein-releasing ABC transporter permease subunit [Desulfobacterales bacterium]|nr:lipoprotein-releasing ABC transporter permease subunit [Desulfobacterales bacterium]